MFPFIYSGSGLKGDIFLQGHQRYVSVLCPKTRGRGDLFQDVAGGGSPDSSKRAEASRTET